MKIVAGLVGLPDPALCRGDQVGDGAVEADRPTGEHHHTFAERRGVLGLVGGQSTIER